MVPGPQWVSGLVWELAFKNKIKIALGGSYALPVSRRWAAAQVITFLPHIPFQPHDSAAVFFRFWWIRLVSNYFLAKDSVSTKKSETVYRLPVGALVLFRILFQLL